MKKVLCPGEALIDFVSMNAGKSLKATNGFIKKSQKTPKAEKKLAKKYKADYERRYGNE
jgi:phage-related protein